MDKVLLSTGNNGWATPQKFFDRLNQVFHFNLDPCADEINHKCEKFFTVQDDGLSKNWGGKQFFVILLTHVGQRIIPDKRIGLKSVS